MFQTQNKNRSKCMFLDEILKRIDRVGHVFFGVEVPVGPSNIHGLIWR